MQVKHIILIKIIFFDPSIKVRYPSVVVTVW